MTRHVLQNILAALVRQRQGSGVCDRTGSEPGSRNRVRSVHGDELYHREMPTGRWRPTRPIHSGRQQMRGNAMALRNLDGDRIQFQRDGGELHCDWRCDDRKLRAVDGGWFASLCFRAGIGGIGFIFKCHGWGDCDRLRRSGGTIRHSNRPLGGGGSLELYSHWRGRDGYGRKPNDVRHGSQYIHRARHYVCCKSGGSVGTIVGRHHRCLRQLGRTAIVVGRYRLDQRSRSC